MQRLLVIIVLFFIYRDVNSQVLNIYHPKLDYVYDADSIIFKWNKVNELITLQISVDPLFSAFNSYSSTNLNQEKLVVQLSSSNSYYWRVKKISDISWSAVKTFTRISINNINGLDFWLDPSFGIGSGAGNDVNSWNDKVNNLSFNQSVNSFKPYKNLNRLNDFETIHFGTSNNNKTYLSSNSIYSIPDSNFTVILNYSLSQTNLVSFVLSRGDDVGVYVGATFQNRFLGIYDGNSSIWKTQTAPEDNWSIATYTYKDLFHNGVVLSPYSNLNQLQLDSFSFSNVGAAHFTGNVHFNGDLGEVLIFNQKLNDSTRILVEDYLKWKYTPILNFGNDTVVCDAELELNISEDNGYSQITWSNGQTNVNSITATSSGTYWVSVKSFGLSLTDTINIQLRDKPLLNFQNDTISCVENELFLTYTNLGPFEYSWSNGSITDTIFNLSSGIYFISQNDTANGCVINSDPINVLIDSFSIQSTLGLDRNFCLGSNLELQTSAKNNEPYVYNWSTLETANYVVLNTPLDTTISVEVVDIYGCLVKDTILAMVLDLASPTVDFISDTVCFGENSSMFGSALASGTDVVNDYVWSFPGNSTLSGSNNVNYTHFDDGSYNVNLTVYTDSNCQNGITKPVYLYRLPIVSFNKEIVCVDNSTKFSENSFTFFPDNIVGYNWYINNVLQSNMVEPDLNFDVQGKQGLRLVVESDFGCFSEAIDSIEVFPALTADFTYINNCIGDSISFKDETESLSIVNWDWTFNGFNSSDLQNPKFQYNTLGIQTVSLAIENALGCKSVISKNVEISPQPIASFGFNKACLADTTLFFDNSIVLLDSIISNEWQIESNLFYLDKVSYVFSEENDFDIYYSVKTRNGCSDDTLMSLTINPLPSPKFDFTPNYGSAPLEVSFLNQTTDAVSYSWTFGDNNNSNDVNPKHTYLTNDIYNVTLKAINEFNCENTKTQQIAIIPSELDLELKKLNLEITQNGNSHIVNANVLLSNVGTRNIENADLILRLDNGDLLVQKWIGDLGIGKIIDYSFDSYFIISDLADSKFVCVEAINVNDDTELNLANNKTCKLIEGNIQFSNPYPSPANNFVNIDVVTKDVGICRVDIVNMVGNVLQTKSNVELLKGYNQLQIETAKYQSGKYFLKVTFLEEEYLYSFVVK